jgi:hypothetical protein
VSKQRALILDGDGVITIDHGYILEALAEIPGLSARDAKHAI